MYSPEIEIEKLKEQLEKMTAKYCREGSRLETLKLTTKSIYKKLESVLGHLVVQYDDGSTIADVQAFLKTASKQIAWVEDCKDK